jgi:two-component system chemotaxis sensor kinase CheA
VSSDTPPNRPNDSEDGFHSDDLSQYLQMYVDETEEQLDDLVETMLVLEVDPQDEASLAAAFRLLHSMKGAAGMMGFDQITVLTHHLETRFERLRSGRISLDRVTMNLTLRCIDFLRECNDRLRDNTQLATPDVLLQELRELEERTEKELATEADAEIENVDGSQNQKDLDSEAERPELESSAAELDPSGDVDLGTHYHVVVTIDPKVTLKDIVARAVVSALDNVGDIEATRPEMDQLDDCEDLDILDVIVLTELSPNQILQATLVDGVSEIDVKLPRDETSPPLATTRNAGAAVEPDSETVPETVSESGAAELKSVKQEATEQEAVGTEPNDAVGDKPIRPTKQGETMRVDIDRLDNLMSLAGELVVNRAQFVQVTEDLSSGIRQAGSIHTTRQLRETISRTIERIKSEIANASSGWNTSIHELEASLDLLGQQQAQMEESRRNFGRLDEAIDQLSRVSDSLQRGVLGTRMVPVSPLFNRFKRVVRDLAVDRNKQIGLVLSGENTELDKRMIDALGDPLVHLVRNSVDHGMESPDVRQAAGKPTEGTVSLSAQHRGNHVYIIIEDDGGGIDDAKIRNRLVDRNILSKDAASNLTRQEAIEYIWHPGFSTAEKVTDVSGRGVGMDIVKSRIAELAGTIETESELGHGTTFTLKLPLTLAIISSLLVEIRGIVFAIPKDDVREIVQVKTGDVISVGQRRTFEIRGDYLPLISVDELFHWNQQSSLPGLANAPTEVVILQSSGRTMGLELGRAIGSQDVVIKSLAENFVSIEGLAGASILGNGNVALMLDVAAMLKMAVNLKSHPNPSVNVSS